MKKVICDPGTSNTAFLFSECRDLSVENIKDINRMKRYIDSLLKQNCNGMKKKYIHNF
jgi:hypothetical protein